jgi:hypothetical protein
MWSRKDRIRRLARRRSHARRVIPSLESMESRLVLSGTGFLQGMVYADSNSNNRFDPLNGDVPQAGALVQLIRNTTVLQSVTTGSDGSYLFNGLAPGTYQVAETPPSGYANEGSQANSPLNPVTATTASTITVQVEDLSSLSVTYDAPFQFAALDPSLVIFQASPDGGKTYVPEEYSIGQMPVTVAYPGGTTARFSAYCVDVFSNLDYGVDTFTASGEPLGSTLVPNTNAGAIAYLDNHYGSLAAQTPTSLSQAYDLQALQLAIWKLVYDTGTNLTTFSSGDIQQLSIDTRYNNYPGVKNDPSLGDLEGRALSFISEALHHSEQAVELRAISGTNGSQDLVAPGSLNFGNIPKATPSIGTTPNLTTVGLGHSSVTLTDRAVLFGGSGPTGSITFALYQGTTQLDSETVAVSGDGTYATPMGYTLPATGTVTGAYQWVATYNGDAHNNAVSDADATNERVTVSPASPAITTTASPTGELVGTTALIDTAHLTGGYNPTGFITFSLTAPDGRVVDTESASVHGDGDYSTPAGYVPTQVGTYYWVAAYSGDGNNAGVTAGATDEPVIISPASPGLVTQAAATTGGVVGTAMLSDSAVLSGGYGVGGGQLTFTLTAPDGSTAASEVVDVTGDGTYTTPTAVRATQVGTYTWSAGYNGDGLNNGAIDDGANESVTTIKASPAISTQAAATAVGLVGAAMLSDSAVFSGGYVPGGSITFTLTAPDGTTLQEGPVVITGDGTYSTPTPVLATLVGTYSWSATYSGDGLNNGAIDDGANESVTTAKASPAIATSAIGTAGLVVGSSLLSDLATLSGGYDVGGGTITFALTAPDGTTTTVGSVPVSGVGSYISPAVLATEVGTYTWHAGYSGDALNHGAIDDGANESVTTVQASPVIRTSASETAVGGVGTAMLSDSATLSGGDSPMGMITFTLTAPDGTTTTVGSVPVSGDGTYASPSVLATEVGTYTWHASYGGDGLNNGAIDDGANESVVTAKASPAITTSAVGTAGLVVGSSLLSDSAVLSGGYGVGGGQLTFTLTAPDGSTAASEVVDVTGDGTYTTPIVTLATQVGTYTWHATYSGDALNNGAIDDGANESVTIVKAGPTLTTTAGGSVVVGSLVISGTKYLDLTGDGFSADDTPLGRVTINLFQDSNAAAGLQAGSGGDTLVASTTTTSNGTYSFTVTSPGTYYVQESVPSGYVQTGGGPYGSAGNAYYTIAAAAGHSYSGNNFDDFLIPNCNCSAPSFTVTANGTSRTVTNLAGNTQQGATVTATFKVPAGATEQLTLVSYVAPTPSFSDSNAYQQVIYQQAAGTYTSPGTYSLTVRIPNSYYQIDFVCGATIGQLEPNQNHNAYGPDSANILYHAQQRFISGDNGGKTAPSPMPAPTPATPPTPTPTSAASLSLTDSATLSGGDHPTGQIVFTLYAPDGKTVVYTDTVPVNGDGTYTTSGGDHPGGYVPTMAGTYQWVAVYGGDHVNAVAHDQGGAGEQETVSPATTAITTSASPACEVVNTAALKDTAILSGGDHPTGQIVFTLVSPGGTVVDTETVTVHGDGSYTTPNGFVPMQTGTYYWVAAYSGDTNNLAVTGGAHDEPVVVSASTNCVARGDFATIGFWQNKNGQCLIDQLNGGGTAGSATSLGNWLAASFPHLYGSSADPTNPYETNLAGLTNAQVAGFYVKLFGAGGLNKTYAQIMAVALGAYATDATLAGGNYAQSFGFTMHAGGNGTDLYNVGSSGSALGLANNTSYAVLSLLAAADQVAAQGTGTLNSHLSGINTIFNGINTRGDIS